MAVNLLFSLEARQERYSEEVKALDSEGQPVYNRKFRALLKAAAFGVDGWPALPAPANADLFVHEYEGSLGVGWILYAQATDYSGRLCQKAWDMGPEERSTGWREVA